MTTTYLVDKGMGTRRIEAHSAEEALIIARRQPGDWQIVGTVAPPIPAIPYRYSADVERMQNGRDRLDEGE